MPNPPDPLKTQAQRVLTTTALAWNVTRDSPRAIARRAAHGYIPARVSRRIRVRPGAGDGVSSQPCPA